MAAAAVFAIASQDKTREAADTDAAVDVAVADDVAVLAAPINARIAMTVPMPNSPITAILCRSYQEAACWKCTPTAMGS